MMNLSIDELLKSSNSIICLGSNAGIIQSILDFDYLSGKSPSIKAIIGGHKKYERFFYGTNEIIIPVYSDISLIPEEVSFSCTAAISLVSGRRVLSSTMQALEILSNLRVIAVFAEEVPEQHAIELRKECIHRNVIGIGPATVGLIIPGIIKLGAVGGTQHKQLSAAKLVSRGSVAVMSSSGGMTNELINIVARSGSGVSFAVAFGGERFPLLKPVEAFMAAENDASTKAIAYFGELGGNDEDEIAQAMSDGVITKPVIAYIAGKVAELFAEPPQFGHAKALAQSDSETAAAKQAILKNAGATVPDSFNDFVKAINSLPLNPVVSLTKNREIGHRSPALFISSIARTDSNGDLQLVGKSLVEIAESTYGNVVTSLLLGHQPQSVHTEKLVELIVKLLVDHGPNVSGAVNTMIAASAQKDLVSSLTAGLLTIGPRFGGAVNGAAQTLLYGIEKNLSPMQLVEEMAAKKVLIPGIGHKKYNIGLPDPRVASLVASLPTGTRGSFLAYAKDIESITTKKGSSLILNVDGAIAACMLDILTEYEEYNHRQLQQLVDVEFFNALFVIARTVGFTAHYLDQRRLDQGLFRLNNDLITYSLPLEA